MGLKFSSLPALWSRASQSCHSSIYRNDPLLDSDWCCAAVLWGILQCLRTRPKLSCVCSCTHGRNCSIDCGHFDDTTSSIGRWRLCLDPCFVCHWRWLCHWLGCNWFRCRPRYRIWPMHWWYLPSAWGCRWPARCASVVSGLHGVFDHLWLGHCPSAPLCQPTHQVRDVRCEIPLNLAGYVEYVFFPWQSSKLYSSDGCQSDVNKKSVVILLSGGVIARNPW